MFWHRRVSKQNPSHVLLETRQRLGSVCVDAQVILAESLANANMAIIPNDSEMSILTICGEKGIHKASQGAP